MSKSLLTLIMKISAYSILLYGVLTTSLFATEFGNAQNLESAKITIELDNVPLESALKSIEAQSEFHFTYVKDQVPLRKKVTIRVQNVLLSTVLNDLSDQAGVLFWQIEDQLVVKRKPKSEESAILREAEISIKGFVRDVDTQEPIVGAFIKCVEHPNFTTVTNFLGEFSLSLPEDAKTLEVKSMGYFPKKVELTSGAELTIYLEGDAIQLNSVTVKGIRQSLNEALEIKQKSVNTVDVIVAEDIAKFPQTNVSEAIQRVPGIQIRRDYAGGVGNEVSIRGLPSEYTQVTMNGQAAPNSSDSRSFNFNTLPAEMYSQAEVYKTPLASIDEGGIGGTVNLVTRKPFDLDSQTVVITGEGIYNTQSQNGNIVTPKLSVTYGNNWNNKKFGLILGATYFDFTNNGEAFDVVRYREYDFDTDTTLEGNEFENVRVPLPRYISQGQRIKRTGVNFATQYRPVGNLELLLEGSYVVNNQVETRYTPIWFMQGADASNISANGQFLESATFHDVRLALENQQQENVTDVFQMGFAAKWAPNDWNISSRVDYQFNNRDSERYRFYADNYNDVTYSVEDDYKWFDISTSTDLMDVSQFQMSEARRYKWDNDDNITSGQVDVNRWFTDKVRLSAGLKYRSRNKSRTYFYNRQRSSDDGFPTDFESVSTTLTGFLDNVDEANAPNEFLVHDWDKAKDVYESIIPFSSEDAERKDAYYDINESISAGYFMGDYKNEKFELNAGIRLVNTALTAKGYELDETTGEFNEREAKSSYFDLLPSANLKLEVQENVFVRAGAARVMTRPSLGDLSAYREVDDVNMTISANNPDLDPFRANQYDISLELYPKKETIITIGYFRKDIESFITDETRDVEFNGETYRLSQPVNGNNAVVEGVEIGYQQPLTFLPKPFDGLGLMANFTLSASDFEEVLETGETEIYGLPNNSKNSYNFVTYYEKGKFSIRLAHNFRSAFLRSKPVPEDGIKYRDNYHQTDISAGYDINDHFSVSANILNAFNSRRYEYIFEKRYQDHVAVYGRTFQIGLRASL